MIKTTIFTLIFYNCFLSYCQNINTILVSNNSYQIGFLLDSVKHGEWNLYRDSILEERIDFFNGIKDGEALKFYENGVVKMRAFYLDGELNGNVLFYSKEGKLIANYFYDDGIFDGNWFFISNVDSPPTHKTYRPKFHMK